VEAQTAVNRSERGITMGKVADRLQAIANTRREAIREALKPNLEPDEELRWFSVVQEFKVPAPWRWLLNFWLQSLLVKYWYVGITPKRVLFGRMKLAKPEPSGVIAVPLVDVTVGPRWPSGGELFVANPKDGLPRKLRLVNGRDINELQALLSVQPAVPAPASAPAE
jgi:hypothetical protein